MKKVKKSPRVYPEGKVHTLVEKNHFSQKIAQKLYKSTKTNSRGETLILQNSIQIPLKVKGIFERLINTF
jgi:hypothetical protein